MRNETKKHSTTLSFKKFQIAKINNPQYIIGGVGIGILGCDDDDNTGESQNGGNNK